MARCRADWRQVLDAETGHWCWHSALRQESRWEKPPIREGWMEWRDANGNAFYVDDAGGSTWEPPWADDADDEAPETTREAPDAPVAPQAPAPPPREAVAPQPSSPPPPPFPNTDAVLAPGKTGEEKGNAGVDATDVDRTATHTYNGVACGKEGTYAPPRAGTDLLAYERRRAAALVAAYRKQSATSRERRLRDDREALDRDRAALDRERQLLALARLRTENRNLPARATVAALVVATGLARNQ